MIWEIFTLEEIVELHDMILNPGELTGFAGDKSLDAALMRVENRVNYKMIEDYCHLAATYAMAIATGHCFNDGNKRTAFHVLNTCLDRHGIELYGDQIDLAKHIINLAQGIIDEDHLTLWLRKHTRLIED